MSCLGKENILTCGKEKTFCPREGIPFVAGSKALLIFPDRTRHGYASLSEYKRSD
jgi:hypothetical protein